MAVQIQIRRDSAADWASNNPVLAEGEFAWETDTGTVLKLGDGSTAYNSLPNLLSGAGGDHLLLSNIGVNTHAQIDTHLADATVHFTEASIDHTNILDIGVNSHTQIDAHIADTSIHFAEGTIDHTALLNIGTNSHAVIDSHIADGTLHFTEASIDHTAILNVGTNTHAQLDTHVADATIHFTEASIDHTAIANIGTNSHAQIDTHIADTDIHYSDAPADAQDYVRNNNAWVVAAAALTIQDEGVPLAGAADTLNFVGGGVTATGAGGTKTITIPVGGVSDHGALTGLADDDHLQYLLVDGTRAMSGALDMGTNAITNVGLVDGVDISAHVADATIHFTEASIDHTAISNIGTNSHAQIDTHIADATIHFTEASIDHTAISNIGTNSHAAIDTHIADGTIHFTEGSISHLNITDIGTNTHAQIDSHIASTANPHTVTLQQAFDAGNIIDSTTAGLGIPDMTTAQRTALADVAGLVVYDTDIGQLHQNDGAGWSIPGAGLTTLQNAYDNSAGADPMITINGTPAPFSVRASVSGAVFDVEDVAGQVMFEVDADPDLIVCRAGTTLDDTFLNGGATTALTLSDTYTQTGPFIGGGILSNGTVTTGASTTWVWALLQESKAYAIGINPAFAAFTLFNALAIIRNSGNFNLPQALILNAGLTHQRVTSGTSTTAQSIGLSMACGPRTTVSGATMTYTTGLSAVTFSPNFGTAAGSTINFGTLRGLHCRNPAVALFQPSAGVENMTAYVGVEIDAISFGGNVTKRGIRSALAAATNARFIESTGTAESDHAGNFNLDSDFPNGILRQGATPTSDWQQGWVGGTNQQFMSIGTPAVSQIRHSSPEADRWVIQHALGQGEFNISSDKFSLGSSTGAVGNQVGNFVTPARTISVAGEWADFLLTQGGNLTVDGNNMSRVSAWVINGVSYASSSGTVTEADTLTVGGFPTSSPGVTITERQSLHVIAGRSRFDSAMQYESRDGGALAAGDTNNSSVLLTGTNNNNMRHWVRIQGDGGGTSAITGFDATVAQDGDAFKITNDSANSFDIDHQAAGSTAANRVISPTGADYTLAADQSCEIIYDANASRWRIINGTGT